MEKTDLKIYEERIKKIKMYDGYKDWFNNFIDKNNSLFSDEYKPYFLVKDCIKTPKDLYYISLIIAFFGYDGEDYTDRGFSYFFEEYNIINVFTNAGIINYNLVEIELKFFNNLKLVAEINKNESEDKFGVHMYNIWKNKFLPNTNLNFIYDFTSAKIFINEFIFIVKDFIENDNIFFNGLSKINFDTLFSKLLEIKNNSKTFHYYGMTFFFDYIKIIQFLSTETNIIKFDKKIQNEDIFFLNNENLSIFFNKSVKDIKKGLKRFTGIRLKDGDINFYDLFKEFYGYISLKYKDNQIYKKLSTYEKLIYMENTLCFLGK